MTPSDIDAIKFGRIPRRILASKSVKFYALGALTWDYVRTILDIVSQKRIPETKALTRQIRELDKDYEQVRSYRLSAEFLQQEWMIAEKIEECVAQHIPTLALTIDNELGVFPNLDKSSKMLLVAVYTALTFLSAMKLYAKHCDEFIRKYYDDAPHSIMPNHFDWLIQLIPEYAGDCRLAESQTRKDIAQIICNILHNVAEDEQEE